MLWENSFLETENTSSRVSAISSFRITIPLLIMAFKYKNRFSPQKDKCRFSTQGCPERKLRKYFFYIQSTGNFIDHYISFGEKTTLVNNAHLIRDYKNNKGFIKSDGCVASIHSPGIDFAGFICLWLVSHKRKWRCQICLLLFTGAFGIDRSYSYSASLGKYYSKGSLSPCFHP